MAKRSIRKNRSIRRRLQIKEAVEKRNKQRAEETTNDLRRVAIGFIVAGLTVAAGVLLFAIRPSL